MNFYALISQNNLATQLLILNNKHSRLLTGQNYRIICYYTAGNYIENIYNKSYLTRTSS